MACDSLISGGYRYPFGTKLMLFARKDCALAWEGGTSYTYSFAVHAKTDIDWSDKLSQDADIDAICRRFVAMADLPFIGLFRSRPDTYPCSDPCLSLRSIPGGMTCGFYTTA
jgi:hypothetical protein